MWLLTACGDGSSGAADHGFSTSPVVNVAKCGSYAELETANEFVPPTDVSNWNMLVTRSFGDASSGATAAKSAVNTDADVLHTGIDIGVSAGTTVRAVANGVVVKSGTASGYGHRVLIEHVTADGIAFTTLYGHLDAKDLADCGPVHKGDPIGKVGTQSVSNNGGYSPHLHFAVQQGHNVSAINGYASRKDWPELWCAPATFVRQGGQCKQGMLRIGGVVYPGTLSSSFDPVIYDEDIQAPLKISRWLNASADETDVSLSDDGRIAAFTSNRSGTDDIYILDRGPDDADVLSKISASSATERDCYPALSANGRYVVFVSKCDTQNSDVVLYDRANKKVIPLPGLNTPWTEWWPSISSDGRFIAYFASNSFEGLRVYDRNTSSFLPLPSAMTRNAGPWSTISANGRYLLMLQWNSANSRYYPEVLDLKDPTFQTVDDLSDLKALGGFADDLSFDGTVVAGMDTEQRISVFDRSSRTLVRTGAPFMINFSHRTGIQCWPRSGARCMP
jgi:murein DD-endopeptidase MepM/ murein hydrolase activator NlpD